MLKYLPSHVKTVFVKPIEETMLQIPLTGCRYNCPHCDMKELRFDSGDELTVERLESLVIKNPTITCVCFIGGNTSQKEIKQLNTRAMRLKKKFPALKIAFYTGELIIPLTLSWEVFDYVKVGPPIPGKPLTSPTTNQVFYEIVPLAKRRPISITYKFWKKHED